MFQNIIQDEKKQEINENIENNKKILSILDQAAGILNTDVTEELLKEIDLVQKNLLITI